MWDKKRYDREKYHEFKNKGLCPTCKKSVPKGQIHCSDCMEENRKRRKAKYWKNVQVSRAYARQKGKELHLRALKKVADSEHPICVSCGCDFIEGLEINHKNGKSSQERKGFQSQKFYLEICDGRRSTEDLEILCKVCNIKHYLSTKFGINWQVTFVNR